MIDQFAVLRSLTLPGGASTGPRVVIGPDIPPPLLAFYAPNTVIGCIIAWANATDYQYYAWLNVQATGETIAIRGEVTGLANVYEYEVYLFQPLSQPPRNLIFGDSALFGGGRTDGTLFTFNGATAGGSLDPFHSNYSALQINANVDLLIDHKSAGRGLVDHVSDTANTAAIGAEAVVLTGNTVVFQARRAFEVIVESDISGSVANAAFFNIRRNNIAGTVLRFGAGISLQNPGFGETLHMRALIRNDTGANITDKLVLTQTTAIAGTTTGQAGGNRLRYMEIRDLGFSADYPNAFQI